MSRDKANATYAAVFGKSLHLSAHGKGYRQLSYIHCSFMSASMSIDISVLRQFYAAKHKTACSCHIKNPYKSVQTNCAQPSPWARARKSEEVRTPQALVKANTSSSLLEQHNMAAASRQTSPGQLVKLNEPTPTTPPFADKNSNIQLTVFPTNMT